jgi:hypothetical protein
VHASKEPVTSKVFSALVDSNGEIVRGRRARRGTGFPWQAGGTLSRCPGRRANAGCSGLCCGRMAKPSWILVAGTGSEPIPEGLAAAARLLGEAIAAEDLSL